MFTSMSCSIIIFVAILCAYSSTVPFMADESMLSVPGLGKIEYNLKYFMSYAAKIQDKVEQLNTSAGKNLKLAQ